jgi:hypothetical protein
MKGGIRERLLLLIGDARSNQLPEVRIRQTEIGTFRTSPWPGHRASRTSALSTEYSLEPASKNTKNERTNLSISMKAKETDITPNLRSRAVLSRADFE